MSQAPQLGGDPVVNVAFYVVARPGAVLNAAGGHDWTPIGAFITLQEAINAAAPVPGAAIMQNVCVHINPPAPVALAAVARAVPA